MMFTDYRYFLSHQVNLNVMVCVTSIELAAIDTVESNDVKPGNRNPLLEQSICTGSSQMKAKSDESTWKKNRNNELFATLQIFCDGSPIHPMPISTRNPPRHNGSTVIWNEWVTLPIKYKDLARNACVGITIWAVGGVSIGSTTFHLFNEKSTLVDGLQHLLIYPNTAADCSIQSKTLGTVIETDESFRLEKLREKYDRNEMPRIDWLDRLSFKQMSRIRQHHETPPPNEPLQLFRASSSQAKLWIELPYFGHPVVYEEDFYTNKAYTRYPLDNTSSNLTSSSTVSGGGSFAGTSLISTRNISYRAPEIPHLPTGGQQLVPIPDLELGEENPVEFKYHKLARDILRGSIDPSLKPDKNEKAQIEKIFSDPNDNLTNDEKDLLWRFRYTFSDNRKAVTKVLLSVDWNDEDEAKQMTDLLVQWAAPIDIADALKLLGRQKEFQHDVVRRFAVKTISQARDEELLDYLLQLVQALRYEECGLDSGSVHTNGESATLVTAPIGPLALFLIDRACKGFYLANYFYWYLKVELNDPLHGNIFRSVFNTMVTKMKRNPDSRAIYDALVAQDELMSHISSYHGRARDERGKKDVKEQKLKQYLKNYKWPTGLSIRLPLDPTVKLVGIVPASCKMFKSALYPAVIEFRCLDGEVEEDLEESVPSDNLRESLSKRNIRTKSITRVSQLFGREGIHTSSFKVMFKKGDDLRQDQLIMQIFLLMDRLLKKVNLDLKLTPYRILATGTMDGLMEFVLNSYPVSHVVASYETPQILSFLREQNPDAAAEYGVAPEAMSTYVKSVAGYCVLTYLLGIGDRHLDNVMMKTEGHLFHIDFGCIFGRDPKPYPPPFKLTKEMVEGMGGIESEHYVRFKTYCCQAYNWLRKSASLILNLLNLMVDAGIEELSNDPTTTLAKVQEKFRLDLTDEQAEQFFVGLINDSVTALFPVLMEYIHKVAAKLR